MEFPKRKLHRLKSWDYSQNGYYYVTICTQGKQKRLCQIHQSGLDVIVEPTAIGQMVLENWKKLHTIYPTVKTDYFCLMPNHIHGIVILEKDTDTAQISLSKIIQGFKSVTTRQYNKMVPERGKNTLWQSSYYDEIIRNDQMLYDVRNYICGNPSKWLEDTLYVD